MVTLLEGEHWRQGPWPEPHKSGNLLITRRPGVGVLRREKLVELGHFSLQLPAFQLKQAKVKTESLVQELRSPGSSHPQPRWVQGLRAVPRAPISSRLNILREVHPPAARGQFLAQ